MSTSILYHGFGIKGYRYQRTRYEGGVMIFDVEPRCIECPRCGSSKVSPHGARFRLLKTVPIGRHPVSINVRVPKIHCSRCASSMEIHPPFADPWRTYTHQLESFVVDLCRLTTIKGAAEFAGVSWDVAKDIEKRRLKRLYSKPSIRGVQRIAVDEIAVRKGHRYMTLVMDLDSGRILFVNEGKDAGALAPFLERVRRSRVKLKTVAMDLSAAYALAVRTGLPKVAIVFDRFHVVKLMNQRLDELRRAHVQDTEKALRKHVKGVRYLVLMRSKNLDELETRRPGSKERLRQALSVNEPLSKGYYLKEKLCLLWDEPTRADAERLLEEWFQEAEASGVRELQRMAKTVGLHRQGILAYFDHERVTSGPLEGINNKIKVMKRMAYGFRDDEFFKLKILGLHEARYALVG